MAPDGRPAELLQPSTALLIAPGSPYRSMDGALAAITYARTKDVPLLGTRGGFQHLVVEFARNVLGVEDADHGEHHPDASNLFVTALTCSLAGLQMGVSIRPQTLCTHVRSYEWNDSLGETVTALIRHGLRIDSLTEHDWTVWPRKFPWLIETGHHQWTTPPGVARMPLTYTVLASRPADG